jgi:hypothetical protein
MAYEVTPGGIILSSDGAPKATSVYVNARPPSVAKIGNLHIWARNGIICLDKILADGSTEFTQMTVEDARQRCKALHDEYKDLRKNYSHLAHKRDEIRTYADFLEAMENVINVALEQGTPDNQSATRDKIRRRRTTVSIPGKLSDDTK